MSGKTALITGIAGQDGVYLTRFLRAKGYRVVGSSTPTSASLARLKPYLDGVEIVPVDVRDGVAMHDLIVDTRPDEIYNLAAMSSVGASWQHAEEVAQVNGVSVLRTLDSLLRYRDEFKTAPRFYEASSSEIFGLAAQQPQDESTPHYPRSPYGAAKSFAHHITVNYRESYGLFACNGILFNHESPRRGETFVTRKITRSVARIKAGLEDTLFLGNIDAARDWGYAPEYVDAMWRMLQQDEPNDFVVATGTSFTVRDFLGFAFEHAGLDWERHVRFDDRYLRPTEVDSLIGDPSRAAELLDWKPKVLTPELAGIMVDADMELQ
jgi:GDPmannose 4,6-dehydratase